MSQVSALATRQKWPPSASSVKQLLATVFSPLYFQECAQHFYISTMKWTGKHLFNGAMESVLDPNNCILWCVWQNKEFWDRESDPNGAITTCQCREDHDPMLPQNQLIKRWACSPTWTKAVLGLDNQLNWLQCSSRAVTNNHLFGNLNPGTIQESRTSLVCSYHTTCAMETSHKKYYTFLWNFFLPGFLYGRAINSLNM